jgi:uncharacterized DUF497 family protein
MKFEWDKRKAISNIKKHGVPFEEASTVFGDPLSLTIQDPRHSSKEDRYVTIGLSAEFRIIVVIHTDRGDNIRIIRARLATKGEKNHYEKEI